MSHEEALAAADQTAEQLRDLFDAMGSVEQPDGAIWQAYRQARLALGDRFGRAELRDTLQALSGSVEGSARTLLASAFDLGEVSAIMQLQIYGLPMQPVSDSALINQALAVVLAEEQARALQIIALYAITPDPALIMGDEERIGALAPGLLILSLARWLTTTYQASYMQTVAVRAPSYQRQAVATLSKRTTNCCLQVHGQIVGMEEPFRLSGTPRYASQMLNPPFHPFCRTVTALVPASATNDQLTTRMQDGAQAELDARERGTTTQRSPSGTALTP